MERIRDQVALEPAGAAQQQAAAEQSRLARRLKEIADKAGRGGDVGGLLGPLEIDAATFERDLIVGGARRREAAALVRRARDQRTELEAREAALRDTGRPSAYAASTRPPGTRCPTSSCSARCPNTAAELETYLRRLDQVARAMTVAQRRVHRGAGRALASWATGSRRTGPRPPPPGSPTQPDLDPRVRRWPGRRWTAARAGWSWPASSSRLYQTYLQTGDLMTECTQPGCTGTIVDGYCDVCGSPGRRQPATRRTAVSTGAGQRPGRRLHPARLPGNHRGRLLRRLRQPGRRRDRRLPPSDARSR